MISTDDERGRRPLNPPHLGEVIRESMEDIGWAVGEMAARLHYERRTPSRVLSFGAGESAKSLAVGGQRPGHSRQLDAHAGSLRVGVSGSAAKTSGREVYSWPRSDIRCCRLAGTTGGESVRTGRGDLARHHESERHQQREAASQPQGHSEVTEKPSESPHDLSPRSTVEYFFGPLIQAHAGQFRRERGAAVYCGADAKHHPARIGLLGLPANRGTGLEIVLHGLTKGFPKGLHCIRVKADPIVGVQFSVAVDSVA